MSDASSLRGHRWVKMPAGRFLKKKLVSRLTYNPPYCDLLTNIPTGCWLLFARGIRPPFNSCAPLNGRASKFLLEDLLLAPLHLHSST